MTKKELQNQIDELKRTIGSLKGSSSVHQSLIDKQNNKLSDYKTNIENYKDSIEKKFKLQEKRWEILKTYLGVKEEEYAELESNIGNFYPSFFMKYFDQETETKPVKKTRLVKINKSKK